MNEIFYKALVKTVENMTVGPIDDDTFKKNKEILQQFSEQAVTSLMEEINHFIIILRTMEQKYGHVEEGFKLFATFPLLRISIADLHILNYYLATETNQHRIKFLLRSVGLTIFELHQNIQQTLGKSFRHALRIYPNCTEILIELDKAGKSFNDFRKAHIASLKDIRNLTIAHKEQNILRQQEIVDKLDLISEGVQALMIIAWFEDFRKVEFKILEGIQQKSDAKNSQPAS